MPADRKYELVVIGGGPAGSTAARWAARNGISVALVERDRLGGTCLNYGCDPTKALLHAAALFHDAKASEPLGLRIPDAAMDWPAVVARVRSLIADIRGGGPEDAVRRQEQRGIDVLEGEASFTSPREIRVNGDTIRGGRFLIATGLEPAIPPIEGLEETGYITSREAVTLERLPQTMAVIGAGPVGVEFAQMFSRFGTRVTLCEMSEHILPRDEADLANELDECLRNEGVRVQCGARIGGVERRDSGRKRVTWQDREGAHTCDIEEILVAAGRKPALGALALENAGIALENDSFEVDDTLRTRVPWIWAAGDVTRRFPFTHVASAQAVQAVINAFSEDPKPFEYKAIPWVTYTDPALAHVGATTQELETERRAYTTLEVAFSDVPRNIITSKLTGRVRLLVEPDSGRLLGGHILGTGAGELLAPLVLAMRHDLPVQSLADTVLPYPTSVQAVQFAARQFAE